MWECDLLFYPDLFFCCIPYFENRLCFHFSFLTRHSSFFISHSFLRLLVALPLLRHPVFVIYTKWVGDILLIPLSLYFPYSSYNFQTFKLQTLQTTNFQTPNLFPHLSPLIPLLFLPFRGRGFFSSPLNIHRKQIINSFSGFAFQIHFSTDSM